MHPHSPQSGSSGADDRLSNPLEQMELFRLTELEQPSPTRPEPEQSQAPSSAPPWLWAIAGAALMAGGLGAWQTWGTSIVATLGPAPLARAQQAQTGQSQTGQPQAGQSRTGQSQTGQSPSEPNRKGPPPRPVEVVTLEASQAAPPTMVKVLGEVAAAEQATLRSQTGGIVREVLLQPGDRVTAGTTIAVLDDQDQQLAIAEATAQLAQQRNQLARLEVGTRPEVMAQRQAEVRTAAGREREARTRLAGLEQVQPKQLAQRRAEIAAAKSRERTALDNLVRVRELVREGAQAERLLVEAQGAVDTARSDRLRAEAALAAQLTETNQQIAVAKTAVENARSERLKAIAVLAEATQGATAEERAAVQSAVQAAQARLGQARLAQGRTRIVAQTSGVVESRQVSPGDLLQSGGAVATLITGDELQVFLELPESLSSQVQAGTVVTLSARALPKWKQTASVTAVVPAADSNSRRQRVRIDLKNPPQGLLPGMAIDGEVSQAVNRTGFVVSRDWLTRRQDKWLLFTLADSKAQPIEVQMVSDRGKEVSVMSPQLRAGQVIVARGGDGLQPGMAVRVVGQ